MIHLKINSRLTKLHKKNRPFCVILMMLLTTASAWADGSGTLADPWISGGCDVTLVNGTLTVSKSASGNGAMADYSNLSDRPWNSEADNITSVVIGSDVTSIGANAFNGTAVNNYYINNIPSKIALSATTPFQIANETQIHVFTKMKSIFENATNWSNYAGHYVADIDIVHVESITLDNASMVMKPNTSGQLNATINPANARVKDVVFISSNPSAVTIVDDQTGTFEAGPNNGTAIITCTAEDGSGVFATCNITVNNSFTPATSVTISQTERGLEVGETFNLSASVNSGASYRSVTWVSSDESVATVAAVSGNNRAEVTAVGPGYATITAISGDGAARATCNVSVTLNGTCGAVNYSLNADGVLTISGTGAMEDYNSYYSRPWNSFCGDITSVVIESGVTHIGNSAFENCNNTNLTSITIPAGVESIGTNAFGWCQALTTITIPASVTSIGESAFYYCTNLATVNGGDGLTSIGGCAFLGTKWETDLNDNITNNALFYLGHVAYLMKGDATGITFAEGTTQIYDYAFDYCTTLTSITIPATVASIGADAFRGCENLVRVYVLRSESVPTLGNDAFVDCNENLNIVVPGTAFPNYAFHEGWKSYTTMLRRGYTVTCNDGITATSYAPIVAQGETVTLNAPAGYAITAASYNDGSDHAITPDNGVYSFQMPAANVTVSAEFEAIPWSGTGKSTDPYLIEYPSQLDLLATNVNGGESYRGQYFVLANDITYSHTTDWNDAQSEEDNYTPIGGSFNSSINSFKGTFDGQGHTVSGIRVYRGGNNTPDDSYLGLFGYVDYYGTIKNVTVADARMTGYEDVGGIVGVIDRGKIENCHATATVALYAVKDDANDFGGIAGYNTQSTISSCSTAATLTIKDGVTGCYNFGGIMGFQDGGVISNNLVVGVTIPALHYTSQYNDYDASGAIVGYNGYNGALENNYYSGCTVGTATSAIGVGSEDNIKVRHDVTDNDGAVPGTLHTLTLGENITAHGALINQSGTISVVEGSTVRLSYSGAGNNQIAVFSLNGTELVGNYFIMPSADATVSASLATAWGVVGGANGSEQNPYVISRSAELDLLATNVNGGNDYKDKHFVLGADIAYNPAAIDVNGDNYIAIGNISKPFNGIFDGRGHTISGIRINQANNSYQGLFGFISDGTVKNVTLSDARITGYNEVGGIVGIGGTIENCLVIGTTVTCNSYGGIIVSSGATLRHNYYSDCKKNNSDENIGTPSGDWPDDDGAVPATILSETQTSMPTLAEGTKTVFRRSFTQGVASTVCLPFSIDATQAAAAGQFYTFVGVDKTDPNDWVVIMKEADPTADPPVAGNEVSSLTANTPYLFKPAATGPVLFHGTAAASSSAGEVTDTEGWTFKGTYERKQWDDTHNTAEIGTIYGFAAQAGTSTDGQNTVIEAGKFFRVAGGANSYIVPFRAYMKYTSTNAPSMRHTAAIDDLPAQMKVRLIGRETTSLTPNPSPSREGSEYWYTLDGRKLFGKPATKGVYIHNGRKIVIK